MKSVLFLCTHNSARSQMAEGLLNHFHGDRYRAFSAGTAPGSLNPFAVQAMAEIGIDISGQHAKHLKEFIGKPIDIVVTVCDNARESCPVFPGAKEVWHESFPDPSAAAGSDEEKQASFRSVRDALRVWIEREFA